MKRIRSRSNDDAISKVAKQVQKSTKTKLKDVDQKWSSSGITLLDLIMGGGIPWGNIINIVGDNSTGKTYLAIEILAYLYLKIFGNKVKWYYDDAEGGFSFNTKSMYGFNIIKEGHEPSRSVEQFGARFKRQLDKLEKGQRLIYILDTLDGLPSEAEIKRDSRRHKAILKSMKDDSEYKEEGSYKTEKVRYLSEFFRLRASEAHGENVCLIIISQVRYNIGVMFGDKYTRTGGKALDHYASHCLWLAEAEKKYKKGRAIGITIKAKLKKSKISTPYRSAFIDIIFDYGVDNIRSNIDFLYDLKTDQGKSKLTKDKATTILWDDSPFSVPGLIEYIEKKGLEDELAKRVIKKWNDIEDSISTKGRKNKWMN